MDPLLTTALTSLAPKVGVLTSIIWKAIADPAALADPRAIYDIGTAFIEKASEVVIGTKELLGQGSSEPAALDQAILKRLTKEFDKLTLGSDLPIHQANQIASAVEDALAFLSTRHLSQATWLKARLSPAKLAEHLVQDCETHVPSFKGNAYAQQVMRAVCEATFDELAKNQTTTNKAVMGALGEVLEGQGQGDQKLDRMLEAQARIEGLLAQKAQESGVSPRIFDPLRKLLAEEGEGISEEKVVQKIQEAIESNRTLIKDQEDKIAMLSMGSTASRQKARDLLVRARPFVEVGDVKHFMPILDSVEALFSAAREEDALVLAGVKADIARGHASNYDYLKAASLYEAAAELVDFDKKAWCRYLANCVTCLNAHGERTVDICDLERAISISKQIFKHVTQELEPEEWATTKNNLGVTLSILGAREGSAPRLYEAVTSFREALKERTRKRVPLDWAATQNNLGNVLADLWRRDYGTSRLVEAAQAYEEALKVYGLLPNSPECATTQSNLGAVLATLGASDAKSDWLDRAVIAFQESLKGRPRERTPMAWAQTQSNLATTLAIIGQRDLDSERLKQSLQAYREALKELSRFQVPLDWARTQFNFGRALLVVSERESGSASLTDAVSALRAALEVFDRKLTPLEWAETHSNLGDALMALGQRESGTARLEDAVSAYCEALTTYEAIGTLHFAGMVRQYLERTKALIASRRQP